MRPAGKMLGLGLMGAGLLGIVLAYFVSPLDPDGHLRRFWFAYLFGIAAVAAVSCTSLIILLIQTLVRSGWIINLRRILETMAVQVILVGILVLPIIGLVLAKNGNLYSWAKPSDTPIVHHHEGGEGHGEAHGEAHHGTTAHGAVAPGTAPHDATAHSTTVPATTGHSAAAHHGAAVPGATTHATGDAHAPAAKPGTPEAGAHVGDHAKDADTKHAEHNDPKIKREHDDAVTYPNEQVRPGVQRDFDENIARKTHTWLNPTFWSIRMLFYFITLGGIAYWYWSSSIKQDATGDLDITARLFTSSAPLLFATGVITSFIAFDLLMCLDPHWFSTMFGVYFFASGTQATWAILALSILVLQSRGYMRESVTMEHRHDLGKFLWAFIVFWTYIAFSQYMLQWYANLPEETFWYDKRGYSGAHPNGYTPLPVALLFGRFVIPFLGLLSRHVKRNRFGLGFWAAWVLVFFVVDMYLLVLPEYQWVDSGHLPLFGLPEVLAFGGIAALWFGNVIRVLGNHELRAVRDPRVHESLALQNY
jgi:hypothetical protein